MEINILIDEELDYQPEASQLQDTVKRILTLLNVPSEAEMGLVITTQDRIRELNREYLNKDEPTDVLSFYMTSPEAPHQADSFILPPDGLLHLGEVIISYPQALIQASEHKHPLERELTILIIHGILHLLGYEDEKPEPKKKMTAKEREILNILEQDQPKI